jgi:hypothetical protein
VTNEIVNTLAAAVQAWASSAANPGQVCVITLHRTICGPVILPASCPKLLVLESIIDAGAMLPAPRAAITALGAAAEIQRSTLFGTVAVRRIEAGNCLFTALVTASRLQEGCVRFSHMPSDAQGNYATPRRFRCQPELAQTGSPTTAHADIARRLTPVFNGLQFGEGEGGVEIHFWAGRLSNR